MAHIKEKRNAIISLANGRGKHQKAQRSGHPRMGKLYETEQHTSRLCPVGGPRGPLFMKAIRSALGRAPALSRSSWRLPLSARVDSNKNNNRVLK